MGKKIVSTQFLEDEERDEIVKLNITEEEYMTGYDKKVIIYDFDTTTYKRK